MITAAALLRLLLTLVMVLCIGGALYLLQLLLLLLLLCIADLLLKLYCACGFLCLMRLSYKKGSLLLRTGNTI